MCAYGCHMCREQPDSYLDKLHVEHLETILAFKRPPEMVQKLNHNTERAEETSLFLSLYLPLFSDSLSPSLPSLPILAGTERVLAGEATALHSDGVGVSFRRVVRGRVVVCGTAVDEPIRKCQDFHRKLEIV